MGGLVVDGVDFEGLVDDFVPGEALLGEDFEEWIGVEFFDVVHAGFDPLAGEEHHGAGHGGHAGGVAHGLHAGFLVGGFVRAVVIYIIGEGFAFLVDAGDAAADGGFAVVVFAEVLGVGERGFEELQGHDFCAVVVDFVDAGHADVLDYAQVGEVFLSECHPEASATDCGVVEHQRFEFFVV